MKTDFLEYTPAVAEALHEGKPVVALESTIIAHGMPHPQNVETALEVENIIREKGAVPATIAVVNGKCRVGLSAEQIKNFGSAKNVVKTSVRDLPSVLSKKLNGATTVAATMRIAALAGIRIFATGGIGGVHREAAATFDISADLTEMQRTSVAIVSAGIKSILDVPATLEYLETASVPVIAYRQDAFPCFYSAGSPHPAPIRMNDCEEIARLLHQKWHLGLEGAVLIANPIPALHEIPFEEMETFISYALEEARRKNISGKAVTPFLLQHITALTSGRSLEANMSLIRNNASLAADLALALSGMQAQM